MFWILGRVFRFCDVFWILGGVLDSGTCFWILGGVLDSGTCFGFWEVFWILRSVLSLRATVFFTIKEYAICRSPHHTGTYSLAMDS